MSAVREARHRIQATLVRMRTGFVRLRAEVPRVRRDLRRWRGARPFWGGLLLILAGLDLLYSGNLGLAGVSVHAPGFEGYLAYLLPSVLMLAGVLVWLTPQQRLFYSVVGVLTAMYSLIGLNLGGFFLGTLLGIIGSALAFAWLPAQAVPDGAPDTPRLGPDSTSDAPDSTSDTPNIDSDPAAHRPRTVVLLAVLAVLTPGLSGPLTPVPLPVTVPAVAVPAAVPGAVPGAVPAAVPALAVPTVSSKTARMTASTLKMENVAFRGVVGLSTGAGTVRALRFTMDRSVSTDFALSIATGKHTEEQATKQLTVSGNVDFYASRFSGRLLGVPLTFTVNFPPPLTLSTMDFTAVNIDLVFLSCDSMALPGLHDHLVG